MIICFTDDPFMFRTLISGAIAIGARKKFLCWIGATLIGRYRFSGHVPLFVRAKNNVRQDSQHVFQLTFSDHANNTSFDDKSFKDVPVRDLVDKPTYWPPSRGSDDLNPPKMDSSKHFQAKPVRI